MSGDDEGVWDAGTPPDSPETSPRNSPVPSSPSPAPSPVKWYQSLFKDELDVVNAARDISDAVGKEQPILIHVEYHEKGPLLIGLAPWQMARTGCKLGAVVTEFRQEDGQKGAAEKANVTLGDRLVTVNGTECAEFKFEEILSLIKSNETWPLRLDFMPQLELAANRRSRVGADKSTPGTAVAASLTAASVASAASASAAIVAAPARRRSWKEAAAAAVERAGGSVMQVSSHAQASVQKVSTQAQQSVQKVSSQAQQSVQRVSSQAQAGATGTFSSLTRQFEKASASLNFFTSMPGIGVGTGIDQGQQGRAGQQVLPRSELKKRLFDAAQVGDCAAVEQALEGMLLLHTAAAPAKDRASSAAAQNDTPTAGGGAGSVDDVLVDSLLHNADGISIAHLAAANGYAGVLRVLMDMTVHVNVHASLAECADGGRACGKENEKENGEEDGEEAEDTAGENSVKDTQKGRGVEVDVQKRQAWGGKLLALLSQSDKLGMAPSHFAASKGHIEVIRVLLAAGTDLSARAVNGATPAHAAAKDGQVEVLRLLMESGQDVLSPTTKGNSPLDVARLYGQAAAAALLSDHTGGTTSARAQARTDGSGYAGSGGRGNDDTAPRGVDLSVIPAAPRPESPTLFSADNVRRNCFQLY